MKRLILTVFFACLNSILFIFCPRGHSNFTATAQTPSDKGIELPKLHKVTSEDELVSGWYLIVYEAGNIVFDGSLKPLDVSKNGKTLAIDKYMLYDSALSKSAFYIDREKGTIRSASGCYIGNNDNATNGLLTSNKEAFINVIAFTADGYADILSYGTYLRYNKTSGQERFRYYKSATYKSQSAIALYRCPDVVAQTVTEETPAMEASEDAPALASEITGWLELPAEGLPEGVDEGNIIRLTVRTGESRNYTSIYDKSVFAPLWSAYAFTPSHYMSGIPRPPWAFHPDIERQYQVTVKSGSYQSQYGNGLYARGHHVPNADRSGNPDMQKQTFYVTNQSPQLQAFNGSVWGKLEEDLRNVVSGTDTVYIVTGPLFRKVGGNETINYLTAASTAKPASLPIPNYFWKAALKVKRDEKGKIERAIAVAFIFEPKEEANYKGDSYLNYIITVDQLEVFIGYDLFANLPAKLQAVAEANVNWKAFVAF